MTAVQDTILKTKKTVKKRGYTWTPNIADRVMKSNMKKKNAVNNNESVASQLHMDF